MAMAPKVSIVIPARNRAEYIRAAVGSVLRQSRRDFELIVVDDGSTDDTYAVARETVAGDPRARVLRTAQHGVCAALNTAAGAATGEYLGWVDSDDALAPTALERTAALLDARPELGMVYTQHLVMDTAGTVLGRGQRNTIPYSKDRLLVDFMTFHFRLMRRELFERVGGMDESTAFAEDYDLCLRLSEVTTIEQLPEPLYFYRVHDGALSKTHRAEQLAASRAAVERALARRGMAENWELLASPDGRHELRPRGGERGGVTLDWSFLERPAAVTEFDAGLVSCLCVTRGRYHHLYRAIRCFEAQTYPRRELIVVYEDLDEASRKLLEHPVENVRFVHVPKLPKQPLGALRNASLRAARGEFVCGWDDDDWHAPRRIELQLRALLHAKADACLLSRWLILNETTGDAHVSGKRLWEGSLLCRRALPVLEQGYPPLERGEDRILVQILRETQQVAALDRPELYIYTYHGANTWDASHFDELVQASLELPAVDARRIRAIVAAPERPKSTPTAGYRSSIDTVIWPAVVTGKAAELLALQRELDETQWWRSERLRAHQLRQLRPLLEHAAREVPFYAERLREARIDPEAHVTEASWERLPILTRADVQALGDRLNAREIPKSHGEISLATTGGSSGVPVRIQKTELSNLLWFAIHVREEIWHRESRGTLARIRRTPSQLTTEQAARVRSSAGLTLQDWGFPSNLLWQTGPLALMDDRVSIPDQAAFLRRLRPEYLFTFPANLRLLLAHFREQPAPALAFRSVWTMSEVVDDTMRALTREVFDCRIVHNYTTSECGYVALQCPESHHFHVQSEVALVEVLDVAGRGCRPGEIGRVVITPLHNFATPLLRYEIGDEAEVGEACACGRGLPVLRRIVGRCYDYLTLPSGARRHVDTGHYRICAVRAVREFQLAQRALDLIELRLVLSRALTPEERGEIQDVLRAEFGPEFRFQIAVLDAIPRTEAGKLRSFVSEL